MPSLWTQIEALIAAGDLIAPEDVLLELERGGDDLYEWANNQTGMFVAPSTPIQERVAHIVNTFPDFVPERVQDGVWADPYVIAVAQEHNASVVTSELVAPDNARRVKIPNVCAAFGVPCLTPLEFFREQGWQF